VLRSVGPVKDTPVHLFAPWDPAWPRSHAPLERTTREAMKDMRPTAMRPTRMLLAAGDRPSTTSRVGATAWATIAAHPQHASTSETVRSSRTHAVPSTPAASTRFRLYW